MAGKIKALLQWCQRMTDGYRDVQVREFTKSWRDGLAFCALIHRFRPDLIDYDSLSKENVFDNNQLAFSVGERELDIPAFLEAADMVALKTPDKLSVITYVSQYYNKLGNLPKLCHSGTDKLSVITYVSQYYNKLGNLPKLGGPGVNGKKTTTAAPPAAAAAAHGVKRHQPAEPLAEPEPKKQPPARKTPAAEDAGGKVKTLGDRCGICGNKVYLLERHVEDGKLYHRSCFRHSDLSPTNKVYTRSPFFSPSLHGKDGGPASPSADRPSPGLSSRLGDEKHGAKRPADSVGHRDPGGQSEVRKFLFSKDSDSRNKSEDKPATRDLGLGKSDGWKDKLRQPEGPSGGASRLESKSNSTAQQASSHSSMDFLSAGKAEADTKSPKRHLPLIFQAAGSADDGASEKTKNDAGGSKTSLFSKSKVDSTPKSGDLPTKHYPNSVSSVTVGKISQLEKSVSESKVNEKNSGPVAKPRHIGAKVLPRASEVQPEKSPVFPKARPRSSVPTAETAARPRSSVPTAETAARPRSSVPTAETAGKWEKAKSPPALKKAAARPKSPPSRDLSPPPLPSSAPPPLPQTPPTASIPPSSSQHLPKPTSPRPSARKQQATPVSSSSKVNAASKLNTPSSNDALGKPSVSGSSHFGTESKPGGFLSAFGKKAASGVSPRQEEPMDVGTAFREARAQYGEEPVAVMVVPTTSEPDKSLLRSDLLRSLAHVRNTNSSNASTTTTSSRTTQASGSEVKTTLTPSSAGSAKASAHVSTSKVTLGHATDADHKLVSVNKEKEKKGGGESTKKSLFSFNFLTGDSSRKDSEAQKKPSKASGDMKSDKTLPVSKLGETVTITLSTKKTEEPASKPVSILSKQNEKSTDRVPLYKKKADSKPTNKLGDSPKETARKDDSSGIGGILGRKQDRPKSAADVLGGKGLSTPKQASTSTDNSQAPFFTQVKLRDSGQSALERKDRPKSAGVVSDISADAKPSWQQEAERKKAAYRDNGFVDPETKKVVGKNTDTDKSQGTKASPAEDVGIGKQDKNNKREPPPRPAPLHNESWQKEGKASAAKSPEAKKKADEKKRDVGKQDSEQPSPGASAANLKKKEEKSLFSGGLKGILKGKNNETTETANTTPPVKPERHSHKTEKKQEPEGKSSPAPKSGGDAATSSKPAEVSATKKKITVSSLKDDLSTGPALPSRSPPASPPTGAGRKKISVDMNFDFDMSSSMEASDRPTALRPKEKATPPSRPPPPHRTSVSRSDRL
ncbi:hypothetical protein ACOMHN_046579 [Nucella lapillus]